MNETQQVLIAGAGPTGLMMACQLSLHNIPFRIIDKNEDHTTQSRAIVIHAASMEILAQMGIVEEFLKLGKKVQALNYIVKGRVAAHIPIFSTYGTGLTPFPFFLALEQSKTEQLLIGFLEKRGHTIEWNKELVSFTQTSEQVQAVVKNKDTTEEHITAAWLVGADGAKSVVRHVLDIPFGGETYPLDLFVLDCKVSWPLKDDELCLAFSDTSFAGFFPLPGGYCRIVGISRDEQGEEEKELTFEEVNKDFAREMQMEIKLSDPKWVSRYRAHHRYVSQFRMGRCFLAGDAAHIHSPVGAQGMNTGLQDAYNLAWKLAFVIKGQAKTELLDSYGAERLPFARQLVHSTDRAFAIAVKKGWYYRIMRLYIMPHIAKMIFRITKLARYLFRQLSQIGITYPKHVISGTDTYGQFSSSAPRPGERLPYFEFKDTNGLRTHTQQLVSATKLCLLVFTSDNTSVAAITKKYSNILSAGYIPFNDYTRDLYKALDIR